MVLPTTNTNTTTAQKRIIAFTGPKESGKDIAASRLLSRNRMDGYPDNYFDRIPFAGPIKQMMRIAFGLSEKEVEDAVLKETVLDRWPFLAPRKLLQDEANHFRDVYGADVWTRAWQKAVDSSGAYCILVTDLRFPNELHAIQNAGGLVVYVSRDVAEKKLAEQMAEGNTLALNASESHWDYIRDNADVILSNDSTYDDLFDEIEGIVESGLGHWHTWREKA